jgi:hypothetical protein
MSTRIGKDEVTPALLALVRNTSPRRKAEILGRLAFACATQQKRSIAAELQYDGEPMKSPAKETKYGGRFAKRYNWRYRGGYALATEQKAAGRRDVKSFTGKSGKQRRMVRRRIPVTPESKQLQDTGATIKSIDILSANAQVARVGPKTGHGQLILSVHDSTRHPLGMSEEWKQKARETAMAEIMKGV